MNLVVNYWGQEHFYAKKEFDQLANYSVERLRVTKKMAPRARFELATLRLTAECSTVELPGNGQVDF